MKLGSQKALLVVGTIIIVGLAFYTALYKSSPGELSKPHADIAGSAFITDCKKCHSQKDVTPGCLKCHTEIQGQLTSQRGYHAFLLKEKKISCAECHSEHNGPHFELVNKVSWQNQDLTEFKHEHVVFHLKGKHSLVQCEKCHRVEGTPHFVLPNFPQHPREKTFLGLKQDCVSCHKDPHSEGRTNRCESCHDQNKFRPAVGFDHSKFFPLVGGHANLACQKCHVIPAVQKDSQKTKFVEFQDVRGRSCQSCHDSPHRTNWGTKCETCHKGNDSTWALGSNRLTPGQHAFTTFKLDKPHNKATCVDCHDSNLSFEKKYPNPLNPGYARQEKRCESCHKDPHGGQFLPKSPRCIDCHDIKGFRPPRFGVKDHQTYPLTGGHEKASCNSCHKISPVTKIRQFTKTSQSCAECHKDIHGGQFRVGGVTRCDSCHGSFESWRKLSFNHDKQSRFPLDEAHKNVTCSACHPQVSLKNGMKIIQYKPIRSRCEDCHSVEGSR